MTGRKRWTASFVLLVAIATGSVGAMEMGTNFWNVTWGNAWHDYFAEGVNWSTTTNPWRPDFLADMGPYTCIRFMDWVPTNTSSVRYWSSRISKTANHYSTSGVAYEWQIDLCNRVGADIWITVPHLTVEDYEANPTNNYWVSLANLIKQQLDPNLNVYVEYSNETWNGGFGQGTYCQSRGLSAGYDPDGYSAGFYFHVYAALRLQKVFLDVFSDQPQRIKKVIAGQAASGWPPDKNWGCYCQMMALQNSSINPWGLVPDFYSIAPYAGGSLNGASPTIRTEWTASVATSRTYIQEIITTMSQHYGTVLPICLYECGQHILNNSHIFAQNPQSYDMYTEYLNAIDDNVAVAAHYTHSGTWASGGAWGAKESTWQSLANAHKYRAILDYASAHATEPPGQASNPSPANGATGVNPAGDLAWSPGKLAASYDVYLGTVATPGAGEFRCNQTDVTFAPGALASNTTYYWRVDSVNPAGTTTGVVWSFTTEPVTIRINPIADASSQSGNCNTQSLSFSTWNHAFIKFDLSNIVEPLTSARLWLHYEGGVACRIDVSNATSDAWTECVSVPTKGGTLMSQVYAPAAGWYEFDVTSFVNAEAAGDNVITFCVTTPDTTPWIPLGAREGPYPPELRIVQVNPPPGLAINPSPAGGETNVDIDADLSWTAGAGATSHDVYFGTVSPPPFIQNQATTTFEPGTLGNDTMYYWRINEKNAYGTTVGVIWSFRSSVIPAEQAENPDPPNGATDVFLSANLSWTAGLYAVSHDVYFGKTNPPPFRVEQTSLTYEPGFMEPNTTYYWRIDERNDSGATEGETWSFTTGHDVLIEYDAASSAHRDNASQTISFSHTVGDGIERALVVGLGGEDAAAADMNVVSVTYNGVAMTPVAGSAATAGTATYVRTELFYMLENELPAPGTYSVAITYSGMVDNRCAGAVSLFNVAQQPPEAVAANSAGNANSISTAITTFSDNAWVVDAVSSAELGSFTATSPGQSERWEIASDASDAAAGTMEVGTAGSASMSWQHTIQTRIAHSLAAFAPTSGDFATGDMNFDHEVDMDDLEMFCDQWLTAGPEADFDDSTGVDFVDFALMGGNWGL